MRLDQTNPFSLTQLGPEGPHNSTNISFVTDSSLPSQPLRASCLQFIERIQGGDESVVLRQWESRLRRPGNGFRLHRARRRRLVSSSERRAGEGAGRSRSRDGVLPHSAAGIHGRMDGLGWGRVGRRNTTPRDTRCRRPVVSRTTRGSWMPFWRSGDCVRDENAEETSLPCLSDMITPTTSQWITRD